MKLNLILWALTKELILGESGRVLHTRLLGVRGTVLRSAIVRAGLLIRVVVRRYVVGNVAHDGGLGIEHEFAEAAGCLVGHNLVLDFDFRKGLQSRVRDGNAGRSRISGDGITFEMRSSKWKCIALVLELLNEVLHLLLLTVPRTNNHNCELEV